MADRDDLARAHDDLARALACAVDDAAAHLRACEDAVTATTRANAMARSCATASIDALARALEDAARALEGATDARCATGLTCPDARCA